MNFIGKALFAATLIAFASNVAVANPGANAGLNGAAATTVERVENKAVSKRDVQALENLFKGIRTQESFGAPGVMAAIKIYQCSCGIGVVWEQANTCTQVCKYNPEGGSVSSKKPNHQHVPPEPAGGGGGLGGGIPMPGGCTMYMWGGYPAYVDC